MIRYTPDYTVADYEQWSGDWELWEGTAVAMTPSPFGRHQFVATNLAAEIRQALREAGVAGVVLSELDWCVNEKTVVRPDVIVADSVPERHLETAPILIAEVLSDSTADKDRTAKFELYQEQGVRFYLIVDPVGETLEAYELQSGRFERIETTEVRLNFGDAEIGFPLSAVFSA